MRVGIVSDTHSRYHTAARALELLQHRGVGCVLHCGDIEDADTVRLFRGVPTHFVLGNCDDDEAGLRAAMGEIGATFHEHFGHLELAGRKLAWLHGDDHRLMKDVVQSEAYDFLFYGHTHHAEQHRAGPTLVVNPGALHRAKVKTCVVLDLPSGELETIIVES